MNVLAINTIGPACQAAILKQDGACLLAFEEMQRGHDVRLPSIVEQVLDDAGIGFAELDRIGVVVGPGSFTGVRVGVAYARGLGLALGLDVVGVTSLRAAWPQVDQQKSDVACKGTWLGILPARKRPPDLSWWVQSFEDGHATSSPEELDLEALSGLMHTAKGLFGECGVMPEEIAIPQFLPSTVNAIATAQNAASVDDPAKFPAKPAYVRAPDAKPAASLLNRSGA